VEGFIDGLAWFGREPQRFMETADGGRRALRRAQQKIQGSGAIGGMQIANCKLQIANLGSAGGYLRGTHIVDIYKYKKVRKCNFSIEEVDPGVNVPLINAVYKSRSKFNAEVQRSAEVRREKNSRS
jgi:hypothetical protein